MVPVSWHRLDYVTTWFSDILLDKQWDSVCFVVAVNIFTCGGGGSFDCFHPSFFFFPCIRQRWGENKIFQPFFTRVFEEPELLKNTGWWWDLCLSVWPRYKIPNSLRQKKISRGQNHADAFFISRELFIMNLFQNSQLSILPASFGMFMAPYLSKKTNFSGG